MVGQTLLLLLAVLPTAHCLGRVIVPGDVYIELIEAIYKEDCKTVESESVQNLQAVKWTVEQLNDDRFTNSLKIGLRVSATCSSTETANRLAVRLAAEVSENDTTDIVGVIGSGNSDETEVISRLLGSLSEQYRLLQLNYASTSVSLKDRGIYKNFFRTIPPDDIQVQVMQQLLKELDWTFVAVIYENTSYGRGGLEGLQRAIEGSDICFPETIAIDDLNQTYIETILKTRVFNIDSTSQDDPPISGIIVFGLYSLAEVVLQAVDKIQVEYKRNTSVSVYPSFVFSETAIYIEGKFPNSSRGSFIPSPRRLEIAAFQGYLSGILLNKTQLYEKAEADIFLRQLYEHVYECDIADYVENDTCKTLTQNELAIKLPPSLYSQFAVQATSAVALAIKLVRDHACGLNQPACDALRTTLVSKRNDFFTALVGRTINFDTDLGNFRLSEFQNPDLMITFDEETESKLGSGFPEYELFNHQMTTAQTNTAHIVKVGEYISGSLVLDTGKIKDYDEQGNALSWPNIRKPQCPNDFFSPKCIAEKEADSVLFIEGDIYIVGIVPVHNIGQTPLKCGSIKQGGVDIVEAMRYAVNQIETESVKRLEAKIGLIIIDSCNDPQIIQERILSLHRLGVYLDGTFIPVQDKILGYVGGWASDVSVALGSLTTRLNQVQISYASTSAELSRRSTFPYFLRVPSADTKQAETIIRILQILKGNFIQILYSESKYGEGGRDLIKALANDQVNKICIANEIPLGETRDPMNVIAEMRKEPGARFIVMFISSFDVERISEAFNAVLNKNEFLFIASEGWGKRQKVSGYTNLVGTITVTSELPIEENFKRYLESLKPDGSDLDPWVREYMEKYYDCYYEWSYNKTFRKPCTGNEVIGDDDYTVELWSPFAERAVRVLLMAAEPVLRENCQSTKALCDQFNVTRYVEEIKTIKLSGALGATSYYVFDQIGDGTVGYFIYALDSDGEYSSVGFSSAYDFSFQTVLYYGIRPSDTVNSTCGNQEVCTKCFPVAPVSTSDGGLPTGAIVVIVLLGLICCVLAAVLLYICNRHGCCFRLENGKLKFSNTYLTPIYVDRQANGPIDGSEGRELPKVPEENYDRINAFVRESQLRNNFDGMSGGGGSNDSSNRKISGQGTLTGIQNDAFDGTIERQNSYADSQSQSATLYPSGGSGGGSAGGSNIGAPEAHRFKKPAPLPGMQRQNPNPVVFQPDGSYITPHSDLDRPTHFEMTQEQTGSGSSKGSSLGYLRSVQNTDSENRF